jgi:GT2 family glycosyltransferase/glycosyltransferase involved in cell wall biosynthesis
MRKAVLDYLGQYQGLRRLAVLETVPGGDAEYFRANAYAVSEINPDNGNLPALKEADTAVYLGLTRGREDTLRALRAIYPHLADKSLLFITLPPGFEPDDCVSAGYALFDRIGDQNLWVLAKLGTVDIVLPVFNAYDHVLPCVESVLKHTVHIPYRLVVIDDASTDPRIFPFLKSLGSERVLLLRNETNQGFVKSSNRGLAAGPENDAVLLNSDTVVTRHWLVNLAKTVYRRPDIAGGNPLSNNASIYSLPEFSDLAPDSGLQEVGAILSGLPPEPLHEIPTAVGFCLFLKRKAIREVGLLDEIFGRGYGEENDFCMRAREKGYRLVLVPNAFVYHAGNVSMSAAGVLLPGQNGIEAHEQILNRRYPHYRELVQGYLRTKQFENIRHYATARVLEKQAAARKRILFFLHNPPDLDDTPGGTEFHVRDLVNGLKYRNVCYVSYVWNQCLFLEEHVNDVKSVFLYPLTKPLRPLTLRSHLLYDLYLRILREFRIDLVHIHHWMNATLDLIYAAKYLNLPALITLHDYYALSPDPTLSYKFHKNQYREDARPTPAYFQSVLGLGHVSLRNWRLEVRQALRLADEIIVPSETALAELRKVYARTRNVRVIDHGTPFFPAAQAERPAPEGPFSVCFTGYTHAKHKGYPQLRKIIASLLEQKIPVHLLGTAPGYWKRFLGDKNFRVHGLYRREEAVTRLRTINPSVVALLSTWKETFSYTLSEGWLAGIPVLAGPLGALRERIARHGGGIVLEDFETETWVGAVLKLAKDPERLRALKKSVGSIPFKTLDESVAEYETLYRHYLDLSGEAVDAPSEFRARDDVRGQGLDAYWQYIRTGRLPVRRRFWEALASWAVPVNRALAKLSPQTERSRAVPAPEPPLDIDHVSGHLRPYFKMKRRALFISGCPRTGTTILSRVLDSHPSVSMTMELGLVNLWHDVEKQMKVVSKGPRNPFEFPQRYHDLIRDNLAKAMLKSREEIHGWRKPHAAYIGDKYPPMVQYLEWLRQKFPDAKFILTLRERRATLESMCKLMPAIRRKAHERTYDNAAGILKAERQSPDVFIVTLEEIRRDKKRVFDRIAGFLEIEPCFDLSLVETEKILEAKSETVWP